jgi:hypothetical protein
MRWVIPGFFIPLGYTDLIALLIVSLLIHEVNVVLFLILLALSLNQLDLA